MKTELLLCQSLHIFVRQRFSYVNSGYKNKEQVMKQIFLLLVLLIIVASLSAQTEEWVWAQHAGGTATDHSQAIAIDADGNSYITGTFTGTASFGSINITSNGVTNDIFVAKLDVNGNWLWAKRAGGSNSDEGCAIATDSAGNCYVTGSFQNSADFGNSALISSGGYDVFIAKLDTNGNWLWAKQAGGTAWDRAYAISADSTGNCYVTGSFKGTVQFGSTTFSSNSTSYDLFVTKLDTNGNWLWAIGTGGTSDEFGYGIDIDSVGNSYVTGWFGGTAIFGGYNLSTNGRSDIFIVKLSANGESWNWAKKAGGTTYDEGHSIASDTAGNTYVTGYFQGMVQFGNIDLSADTNGDIVIAKLNANGDWLWAKRAGGTGKDEGNSIAIDADGNCYVTGNFRYAADFGPFNLDCNQDIFVTKLNSDGGWIWAKQSSGTSYVYGEGIANDGAGNCYVTGSFLDTAIFGSHSIDSNGGNDIFAAKLGAFTANEDLCCPTPSLKLMQNYPNPFNPETIISFSVEDDRAVYELAVFDLRGRKVSTLYNGQFTKGNHNIVFLGKDDNNKELPAGIYLYRLSGPAISLYQKMILLK